MTTSSVSTSASVGTGNAQDVSSMTNSSYSLSMAEAVSTKVQPYLDRADVVATQISTNKTMISAYQNMQSLLQSLETATSNLSTQAVAGSNAFNARTANMTSKAVNGNLSPSDASTLLSASVSSGTSLGSHTVIVNQLAAAESDISATQNVSSTTALGYSGSFTINEAGMTGTSIAVTSSMSLTDIAAAINGTSTQTGVTASVVSIDSSHSVLVVSGQDTDKALTFTDTPGSGATSGPLTSLGLLSNSLTSTTSESDTTSALNLAGSFVVDGGSTVTVTSSMSLSDIASAINAAAGTTGVQATVDSTANTLTISSSSGPVAFSGVTGGVLSGLGITEASANGATHQVTAAQAASLTIDGVGGITSTTNTVKNVVTGLTLDLTAADPNTVVTLNIQPDTTSVANTIGSFVTAYNNWESFVQQNESTNSDGTASSSAVLFGDGTLREASLNIDSVISSMIQVSLTSSSTQSSESSLADIGISLDSSNNLEIDSATLSSALTNNFTSVVNMFQSQLLSSSSSLQQMGTDYSSYSGTFNLGITTNNGTISGLTLNGNNAAADFSFNGNSITGVAGSPYSGMSFTYTGGSATVTVTATQGLGNQIYTTSNNYGNSLNGTVQGLITNLQNEDSGLTTQYNTIIGQANDYTTFLLSQYASLTTQIQNAGYTTTVLNEMFAMQTKG